MNDYQKARLELVKMYINSLEEEKLPWENMWQTPIPVNAISKTKYKGINNLVLSYIAEKRGYKSNKWCTYLQMKKQKWAFIKEAKGQGIYVEFFSVYNKKEKKEYSFEAYKELISEFPNRKEEFRINIKNFVVFNGDLIDGLANEQQTIKKGIVNNDYINNIISNLGVEYKEEGIDAYYNIISDEVVIPPSECFQTEYSYYATQLHELAHSTGHASRLKRNFNNTFGSEEYAKEELRAEISSSFFMQKLKLEYDERHLNNHKSYIQSWLEILKKNPQELFVAISEANKIVDYLEENSVEKTKNHNQENNLEMEIEYER